MPPTETARTTCSPTRTRPRVAGRPVSIQTLANALRDARPGDAHSASFDDAGELLLITTVPMSIAGLIFRYCGTTAVVASFDASNADRLRLVTLAIEAARIDLPDPAKVARVEYRLGRTAFECMRTAIRVFNAREQCDDDAGSAVRAGVVA